jgi:ketosteroid isomerase-like protein
MICFLGEDSMKKLFILSSLTILLCLTFGCQQGNNAVEEAVVDVEADKEAIYAWYDQKTEITNAGDFDGLKILFDEDVIFMPPDDPLFKGWEEYRQWAQPYFDEFDIEEKIAYEEVGVFGDWAFIRTSYTIESTPKAGGESTIGNGKAIWLFKRQADGTWKGTHCIWNSNEPST